MPAFITPGRGAMGLRPQGPVMLNPGSAHADRLALWVPFGAVVPPRSSDQRRYVLTNNGVVCTPSLSGGASANITGVSQYVGLPDMSSVLTTTTGVTVAIWLRRRVHTPSADAQTGLWKLGGSFVNMHYPYTDGNIYDAGAGQDRQNLGPGIVTDRTQLHLYASTYHDPTTTARFFQNGREFASASMFIGTYSGMTVGASLTSSSFGFDGEIIDFRMWAKTLSPAEVWSLYAPPTRWDLYYVPGRRVFFDLAAAPGGASIRAGWQLMTLGVN